MDIGNQYVVPQAQYAPTALAGLTFNLTHGQPGGVCTAAGVRAARASI